MRYLFMDNFRGFANTLIPIRQTNFLVGENSTGKSSVLKLISILSSNQFAFSPDYHLQTADLGGFNDMVSARSNDRSKFSVGGGTTAEGAQDPGAQARFWLYTFEDSGGAAQLVRYSQYIAGTVATFILQSDAWYFKQETTASPPSNDGEMLEYLRKLAAAPVTTDGADVLDKKAAGPGMPLGLVLSVAQSQSLQKTSGERRLSLNWDVRLPFNITEVAPIRTKPQRYYDSMKLSFSPEGDHVPLMLRRALSSRERASSFAKKFRAFGKTSGLFDTIVAHSFGKNNPQSPFELRVKFSGIDLSINNVGYGVSQVFPLIVQFLLASPQTSFSVQQPEVHLHPRAQSALGDLIYALAKGSKHNFMLETHSDYLIDRYRLALSGDSNAPDSQTLFFERTSKGNIVTALRISPNGRYPSDQPKQFRAFFVKEEMRLLDI